ncbi:MAG TPA: hypothetical protein VKT73_05065 [Xanthobacteraceae bacterium]|nr:hypothetical protein [Xanthobacteraceae bacterium]
MPRAAVKSKRTTKPRKKTRADEQRERALEEGLEETFPASDPVAVTEPNGPPERDPEAR